MFTSWVIGFLYRCNFYLLVVPLFVTFIIVTSFFPVFVMYVPSFSYGKVLLGYWVQFTF